MTVEERIVTQSISYGSFLEKSNENFFHFCESIFLSINTSENVSSLEVMRENQARISITDSSAVEISEEH